jgi:hypothetical protein
MRYLFADATPFPLNENFLTTLCSATDACVAILQADDQVDEMNRAMREAEVRAGQEQLHLMQVAQRIEESFGPESATRSGTTVSETAYAKIGDLAWQTISEAKSAIAKQRESAIATAVASSPRGQVLPALSKFLSQHQVPDTAWGIRWSAAAKNAPTKAELYARTPFGLELSFDVAIPNDHLFARPVQASLLEKVVVVNLMKKPLIGKPRPMPERLHELFVTAVTLTPDRAAMTLKASGSKPAEGFEVVLDSEGSRDVTLTRIDRAGYPAAQSEKLGREDAATVHRLWSRVVNTIATLLPYRRSANKALFGGVPVGEVARPAVIAEAIIFAIAPLVREIARRTATPGELALKRFLGDGCREEIFITYETVLERIRGLSDRHHAKFDPFGLRPGGLSVRPGAPMPSSVRPVPNGSQAPASVPPPSLGAPVSGLQAASMNAPMSAPPPLATPVPQLRTSPPPAMQSGPAPVAPTSSAPTRPITIHPPAIAGNVRMLPQVRPPKPRQVASA